MMMMGDYYDDDWEYNHVDDHPPVSDADNYNNNDDNIHNSDDHHHNNGKAWFFSRKTLDDPSAFPQTALFQSLCQMADIHRPSKIQRLAWPILLQGQSAILAEQTGSGKTLAYLIPLLHRLFEQKEEEEEQPLEPTTTTTQTAAVAKAPTQESSTTVHPRLLILTPTTELADQVKAVCDRIARNYSRRVPSTTLQRQSRQSPNSNSNKPLELSSIVLTGTGSFSTNIRDQIRLLQRRYKTTTTTTTTTTNATQPLTVLIATPGRLATLLRTKHKGYLQLQHVQALVLDEVDVLLQENDSFGPQLRTIAAELPLEEEEPVPPPPPKNTNHHTTHIDPTKTSSKMQWVFCTATLPDAIVHTITREFPLGPHMTHIRGPGLHRVSPHVKQVLVDVSTDDDAHANDAEKGWAVKAEQLRIALRQVKCRRTLIFCNTVQSCRRVENMLKRHDRAVQRYDVFAFHNALAPTIRNRNLAQFSSSSSLFASLKDDANMNMKMKKKKKTTMRMDAILVCTDRAARGVDFAARPVDHVILFDFPHDPAEYVRRVGRTGRAGRPGTCTVLAYGWQLPIARSIMRMNPNKKTKKKMKDIVAASSSSSSTLLYEKSLLFSDDDDDDDDTQDRFYNNNAAINAKKKRRRRTHIDDDDYDASNQIAIKRNIEKGTLWQ